MDAKSALRPELIERRAIAMRSCEDAGVRLAAHFPTSIEVDSDTIVAGYMPFRTEIDPLPLWRSLCLGGAHCAAPRINDFSPQSERSKALTFHQCDLDNQSHFTRNKWGLLEPRAQLPVTIPTILLVPLLGFDRQGQRIGYGKGYYDKTITAVRQGYKVIAIGIAFAQQEVSHIPTQPHDQRLDWIITQNEAYRVPS